MIDSTSPMPRTPVDALGPDITDKVILAERTFTIVRPSEPEKLLDHPAIRSAFDADEYLPYWTDLWPAARMLAKAILRQGWNFPPGEGPHALEVGCGLGLPGIAALAVGMRVTFSDYDATALDYAARNARLNGFDNFDLLQMDWRNPPGDRLYPILLGSDLIYEQRNVEPLVTLIQTLLAPDGECLLTDQDRVPSEVLRAVLTERGLPFTTKVMHAGEPGDRRFRGTLYRIRKA